MMVPAQGLVNQTKSATFNFVPACALPWPKIWTLDALVKLQSSIGCP